MNLNNKYFIVIFCLFTVNIFAQSQIVEAEKLLNNGEIEEAKQIFLQNDQDEKAREYLGDIASFQKNWDQAKEYYRDLVKQEPENAVYNFKLAGALGMKAYNTSKFQAVFIIGDVKKYFRKAADLDKSFVLPRRALVELYMELPEIIGGSRTMAESYAHELENINPLEALLAQAYIYRKSDFKELAKLKYEEAIKTALKRPNLITRNYLNYELGEASAWYKIYPEAGIDFLHKYLKEYGYKDLNSPAWAYLRLAQIQKSQNNSAEALNMINKSLEVDPGFEKAIQEKQKIQQM
ncbi:hypothetical protein C7S20_02210 [Christiangramia fulva]|uniref:Tetratricopeptide repeat protein n=1 Tax=Christiangramia fulva TaxID=2126553 RepID=A0A2R3Z1N3_9FLAO|nr:tetratricopeptide repeat protein [Christiangramia fulva]AVR44173.1 hypothetical protein C7S20_02210 [Christiangramia fulva]